MPCSKCKNIGHNIKTCKVNIVSTKNIKPNNLTENIKPINLTENIKPIHLTEDIGKMFEMAICMVYETSYNGKYKYDLVLPNLLQQRLCKMKEIFIDKYTHNGGQHKYDFTNDLTKDKHISAKTTKKGVGKIAPQTIGQCSPKKFCLILEIEYISNLELKKYIQTNIKTVLPILCKNTFNKNTSMIYYNHDKSTIRIINLVNDIDFSKQDYVWTNQYDTWNNSSVVKIKKDNKFVSLVEFQFHSTSRTNMAIRWFCENFLDMFRNNLTIVDL